MTAESTETPDLQEALHRTRTDDPFLTMEGQASTPGYSSPENRRGSGPAETLDGAEDPAGDRPNAPQTPHSRAPRRRRGRLRRLNHADRLRKRARNARRMRPLVIYDEVHHWTPEQAERARGILARIKGKAA